MLVCMFMYPNVPYYTNNLKILNSRLVTGSCLNECLNSSNCSSSNRHPWVQSPPPAPEVASSNTGRSRFFSDKISAFRYQKYQNGALLEDKKFSSTCFCASGVDTTYIFLSLRNLRQTSKFKRTCNYNMVKVCIIIYFHMRQASRPNSDCVKLMWAAG